MTPEERARFSVLCDKIEAMAEKKVQTLRYPFEPPADPTPYREDYEAIMGRDPLKDKRQKPGMFEDWRDAAKVLVPCAVSLILLLYVVYISVL